MKFCSKSKKEKINMPKLIGWDEKTSTIEENARWALLRALEWQHYILFVAQPIVPILFIFINYWVVIASVLVLSWIFTIINRGKQVSLFFAKLGFIVHIKWPVSIGVAIYFVVLHNYFLAVISAIYPLITILLTFLVPPAGKKVGVLQAMFMNKMEYELDA
jgi:hypothetical protein